MRVARRCLQQPWPGRTDVTSPPAKEYHMAGLDHEVCGYGNTQTPPARPGAVR
jgi:hypothetical protein